MLNLLEQQSYNEGKKILDQDFIENYIKARNFNPPRLVEPYSKPITSTDIKAKEWGFYFEACVLLKLYEKFHSILYQGGSQPVYTGNQRRAIAVADYVRNHNDKANLQILQAIEQGAVKASDYLYQEVTKRIKDTNANPEVYDVDEFMKKEKYDQQGASPLGDLMVLFGKTAFVFELKWQSNLTSPTRWFGINDETLFGEGNTYVNYLKDRFGRESWIEKSRGVYLLDHVKSQFGDSSVQQLEALLEKGKMNESGALKAFLENDYKVETKFVIHNTTAKLAISTVKNVIDALDNSREDLIASPGDDPTSIQYHFSNYVLAQLTADESNFSNNKCTFTFWLNQHIFGGQGYTGQQDWNHSSKGEQKQALWDNLSTLQRNYATIEIIKEQLTKIESKLSNYQYYYVEQLKEHKKEGTNSDIYRKAKEIVSHYKGTNEVDLNYEKVLELLERHAQKKPFEEVQRQKNRLKKEKDAQEEIYRQLNFGNEQFQNFVDTNIIRKIRKQQSLTARYNFATAEEKSNLKIGLDEINDFLRKFETYLNKEQAEAVQVYAEDAQKELEKMNTENDDEIMKIDTDLGQLSKELNIEKKRLIERCKNLLELIRKTRNTYKNMRSGFNQIIYQQTINAKS